jgi:anti-sigma B factor antagonist
LPKNVTTTDELEIKVIHGEQGALASLSGRLSIDSSPALRDQLLAILHSEPTQPVVVELTDISYMDSSGIATLIEALKIARSRKTTLRLSGLHGRLLHLFEVTGVLSLFRTTGRASDHPQSKVF